MPTAVKQAIEHAAIVAGKYTPEEAKGFLRLLEREGRLLEESWS